MFSGFLIAPLMKAASFVYDLKFMSFNFNLVAPNNNPYWNSLTKMQARLMPQIGVQLDKRQALMFGAWFIQNLHTHYSYFPYSWGVTMYYQYIGKNLRFFLGIVPRSYQIGHYPLSAFKKLFGLLILLLGEERSNSNRLMILIAGGMGGLRALLIGMGGVIGTTSPKRKITTSASFYILFLQNFSFLKGI